MTMSDPHNQNHLSKPSHPTSQPHKSNPKYPTNEKYQEHGKMEVVTEENEDDKMMDHAMVLTSTTPTWASTCLLAAKLKKITDSTPTLIPMMIDTEIKEMDIKDLKKQARAIT